MVFAWFKSEIWFDLEEEVIAKWIGRRVCAVKCGAWYAAAKKAA